MLRTLPKFIINQINISTFSMKEVCLHYRKYYIIMKTSTGIEF